MLTLVGACSSAPDRQSTGFQGIGTSSSFSAPPVKSYSQSATKPTSQPSVSSFASGRASPLAPGAVPPELASIRPRILENMKNGTPVKVVPSRVDGLSVHAGISERTADAIVAAHQPSAWKADKTVTFVRFGLASANIHRVQLNGRDFLVSELAGPVKTSDPTTNHLLAYRSGCRWDSDVFEYRKSSVFTGSDKYRILGLNC